MTKKKPSPKSPSPQPILKLKLDKFPNDPVPVFYDKEKLEFTAQFGFEEYRAPSAQLLKGKIEGAIKKGSTPKPEWIPVIEVEIDSLQQYSFLSNSWRCDYVCLEPPIINISRFYLCAAKEKGKLRVISSPWDKKGKEVREPGSFIKGYWQQAFAPGKRLPFFDLEKRFGASVYALFPHSEFLWGNLLKMFERCRAQSVKMAELLGKGKPNALFSLSLSFDQIGSAEMGPLNVNPPTKTPKPSSPATNKLTPSKRKKIVEGMKKKWDKKKEAIAGPVKKICICHPKRRADQIGTNPYCHFPHAGKPSGSFQGEDRPGPGMLGRGVGKLDPSITAEFRKALNLKLLAGLLDSEFGMTADGPASNDELMQALRESFGGGGTIEVKLPTDGPQLPPYLCQVTCKGGTGPAVWFKKDSEGKPDLKGKELIAAVREVLEIPCPLEDLHGKPKKKQADSPRPCTCYPPRKKNEERTNVNCKFPHPGNPIPLPSRLKLLDLLVDSDFEYRVQGREAATDAQILEAVTKAFEGNYSDEGITVRSAPPAVWFCNPDREGPPNLQGDKLIAMVRELIKIPVAEAPKPNGHSKPHKPLPIPNGPLPSHVVEQLGYPSGTTITASRDMGNGKARPGNVLVTPPGHQVERYSLYWLEDRLKDKGVNWPTKEVPVAAEQSGEAMEAAS